MSVRPLESDFSAYGESSCIRKIQISEVRRYFIFAVLIVAK